MSEKTLRIPVRPSSKPCEACGKPATPQQPNLQYTLVGISGVLCRPCLTREVEHVNKVLGSNQAALPDE